MADWFEVPMTAILAFERANRLRVCVHELSGALWGFLPPERFLHTTPPCLAAKSLRQDACIRFDVLQTRAALSEQHEGRVHVCHAGLVEWVVPTFHQGRLERVFFAGQRRPGNNLQCARAAKVEVGEGWSRHLQQLEPVDDDEAASILESLRQLAARVELWRLHPPAGALEPTDSDADSENTQPVVRHLLPRQQIIRYFIQERHTKPITLWDLAQRLHVSESRAGHVVKQTCGQSFIELLIQARLRTAAGLLRHTDMSVAEVATASGFRNSSHFHQIFRRHFRCTPRRFRMGSEAKSGE